MSQGRRRSFHPRHVEEPEPAREQQGEQRGARIAVEVAQGPGMAKKPQNHAVTAAPAHGSTWT